MQFCFIKKVTWIAVTNVASECALRKKGVELLGAVGVSVGVEYVRKLKVKIFSDFFN